MTLTPREAEALVRRFLTDVVDAGDTGAVDVFLAEDVVEFHPAFGSHTDGTRVSATVPGRTILAGADVDVDVESVVASGEEVAVRATVTGTHRESLLDLAPTGASFEIAHAWFCRIDDDRIGEIWSLPDGLGLMMQLGAVPEPTGNRSMTDLNDHPDP